ncbi:hypothetical protein MMC13_001158 [Lambiella insularis]|nr:hypothetical protein [Lambiella insularis]
MADGVIVVPKYLNDGTICGPSADIGVGACCAAGDTCGDDLICYYTHPIMGGSGYYVAGCTDPTFSNQSICSPHCSDLALPDVVYNSVTELWACCAVGNTRNCSSPTDETFEAPDPQQLFATSTSSVPSTITSSSSTLSTTSVTATEMSLSTTTAASIVTPVPVSSGLSTGAQIGIGIGAAVVGLAVLAGLVFFFRRCSRRNKSIPVAPSTSPRFTDDIQMTRRDSKPKPVDFLGDAKPGGWKSARSELDARELAQLPGSENQIRHELL